MNNCTNRHNSIPIKNAIAVILAVAFLFTGAIVCPDQIDNTKLAPPSQLNSKDLRYSLTVGAICKYIERDGNLGSGSSLNDVLARLGADKNHSITVLPHEIIIEAPNERVAIRYLDPSKANIITPYSDISRLSTKIIGPSLLRQIIHRVNALPRGVAEVKFTAAYLNELRNRLLELEVAPRITDEIIDVLRQNLKDKEDQWFYSRLVRLTGMADIRQSGQAPRQYHGRVELAKNSGQLRRLINAVTPVYQFDKDGTLDKTNTELKAESARRLASLIIHGRKVGINTARSLLELNKGKDPDTGAPRELYANLREAVIAGIAKEGWDVGPETVADELLIDLFELFLDIGATRLTPRLGAQNQSDLVIDADFQRGCPEKLAEKLQYMLTNKGRSFHHSTIYHIIQMTWRKLRAEGFFENEYGPPVLICHSMPIPKGHPLAEEFGTSVITRIAYRPFGKKAVPEKGTREYRIISWARHVIRDYISEVLYEERKLSRSTKNIEVIPVVTGRATIDITFNFMARKSKVVRLQDKEEKTQKDRAIEYQGKLGHVNIFYFDDEALSGNGLPITRRLKENSILGINLRVFAADPVPNASMKQWEYKGLTYIGGEERGVADYIDKELRRIEDAAQRPAATDKATNVPIVADILSVEQSSPLAKSVIKEGYVTAGKKMLSLGSGNGNDEVFFAQHGCEVLATDNNSKILKHLEDKARSITNLSVQALDVEKPFAFADSSFDIIYARLVLHYFSNTSQQHILDEIRRVLKPGGIAIIELKSKNDILYKKETRNDIGDGMFYFPTKKYSRNHLTLDELIAKIKSNGLEPISYNEHNEKLYSDDYESALITALCVKSEIARNQSNFIDENKVLFKNVLGENKPDVLVRVPVEAIESVGIDNIKSFLATFQEAPNGYIELYYMSGVGEVSETVYQKYCLQKKPLPKDFKKTRENTITLFPALKGEEINQSTIVSRLGSIDVTPEDTILSPIGLQHDPAGLIRATILGLKIMDIARQIKDGKPIDKDAVHIDILNQLRDVLDPADFKNFDLSPDDIIALAAGNINNVIAALKKLIRLLPITPIDAEELKQMYEAVKAVVTAA